MQTLLTLLDACRFDAFEKEKLRRLINSILSPDTPSEISGQVVGGSTRIEETTETFFSTGSESALESLTPIFKWGMAYPEALGQTPRYCLFGMARIGRPVLDDPYWTTCYEWPVLNRVSRIACFEGEALARD